HAILFSGDGDFCRLLEDVQALGVRTTVVSTNKTNPPMVADQLRRMADIYVDMADIASNISKNSSKDASKMSAKATNDA
ncbi:MAG: NYN domain-containing protein, partial [Candidatus Puniceispirillum sp.]